MKIVRKKSEMSTFFVQNQSVNVGSPMTRDTPYVLSSSFMRVFVSPTPSCRVPCFLTRLNQKTDKYLVSSQQDPELSWIKTLLFPSARCRRCLTTINHWSHAAAVRPNPSSYYRPAYIERTLSSLPGVRAGEGRGFGGSKSAVSK